MKDVIYERIKDHAKIFTDFTINFCWKVNNIEYSITMVEEQVPDSVSGRESLDRIIKRMFRQINIDYFEEFTLMFISNIKKITQTYYINHPMPMVQRIDLGGFLNKIEIINIVGYRIVYYILNQIMSLVSEDRITEVLDLII